MAQALDRPKRFAEARWDPIDRPYLIGGTIGIGVACALVGVFLGVAALDVWTGTIVGLVLLSVSVPLFQWIARKDDDPWMFRILFGGLLVKFASSLIRYFVIFVLYDGNADSGRYHEAGAIFATRFREGSPIHPIPIIERFPLETQRIGDVVGGIYVVTGPSAYAGFLGFSFICYLGQVLIVRGLRVAVPEADPRRFALLVLFLPSLLFWPSSIGKEAVIIGCLGLTIYGGALLLAPRPRLYGAAIYAGGLALTLAIRPHVALMSVGSMAVAVGVAVLGSGLRRDAETSRRGRLVRVLGLVAILGLVSVASTRVGEVFGNDEGSLDASSALESAAENSAQGGSEFTPVAAQGPTQIPAAMVSVVFRPFPWEAGNTNSLIAAAEGVLLLGLLAVSWRRVLSFPLLAAKRPFLVFAMGYAVAFAIGFSYLANFGILARQRTQMIPMVLILLALPPVTGLRARLARGAAESDEPGDALVTTSAPAMTSSGGAPSAA